MTNEEIVNRTGKDVLMLRSALADQKNLYCKRRHLLGSFAAAKRLLENPSPDAWKPATDMEWVSKDELFELVKEIEQKEREIANLRGQFEDLFESAKT